MQRARWRPAVFRCEACSGRGWIPVVASDENVLRVIDATLCPECSKAPEATAPIVDQEADVTEASDG